MAKVVANTYLDLIDDMIKYGYASEVIEDVRKYGVASSEFYSVVKQIPGWSAIVDDNGKVTGYCRNLNADIASQIGSYDSNYNQDFLPPANVTVPTKTEQDTTTGTTKVVGTTATKYVDGQKTTGSDDTTGGKGGLGILKAVQAFNNVVNGAFLIENAVAVAGRVLYKNKDWNKAIAESIAAGDWDDVFKGISVVSSRTGQIVTDFIQHGMNATVLLNDGGDGTANNTMYIQREDLAALCKKITQLSLFEIAKKFNYYGSSTLYRQINPFVNDYAPWIKLNAGDEISYVVKSTGSVYTSPITFGSSDGDVYFSALWSDSIKPAIMILMSTAPFTLSSPSRSVTSPSLNYGGKDFYIYTYNGGLSSYTPDAYSIAVGGNTVTSFYELPDYNDGTGYYQGVMVCSGETSTPNKCTVTKVTANSKSYSFTKTDGYFYNIGTTNDANYGYIRQLIVDAAADGYICGYVDDDNNFSYVALSASENDYYTNPYTVGKITVYTHTTYLDKTKLYGGVTSLTPAVETSTKDVTFTEVIEAFAQGIEDGTFGTTTGNTDISETTGNDSVGELDMPQYSVSGDATNEEAANALDEQYSYLKDNRMEIPVVQPDGSVKTIVYYPIAGNTGKNGNTENTAWGEQWAGKSKIGETTVTSPSGEPAPDGYTDAGANTAAQIITQESGQSADPTKDYTIPTQQNEWKNTGDGDTPTIVVPTVEPSALWTVYNPTLDQVDSFGAWLWSSNFIDQLLKIFSDPMSAIIGFHEIYAMPTNGEDSTIHVGYLDSNVASATVSQRYGTVDCGTIDMNEYFGNVFDYDPYTTITLYLPFIGFVQLSTADVMRSTIGIKYNVDFYTGACLAIVSVTRDSCGGVLYQYSGNCASQIPLSSGSYVGIVSGILGIAGSVVGGIVSGGTSIPLSIMGGVEQASGLHTSVQHGGSFAGTVGAMGIKKPYVVISRPQVLLPSHFYDYTGMPSSRTTTVGDVSGFVAFDTIHLDGIPATSGEMDEIEQYLTSGVIV